MNARLAQRALRANDHAPVLGIESQHIKRLGGGDTQPFALADREMRDAIVAAEHASILVDDVARLARLGSQPFDDSRIRPLRHETDVLAVGLRRDRKRQLACEPAGLILLQFAQRKAKKLKLGARRATEEVALVAAWIRGAVQFRPGGTCDASGI